MNTSGHSCLSALTHTLPADLSSVGVNSLLMHLFFIFSPPFLPCEQLLSQLAAPPGPVWQGRIRGLFAVETVEETWHMLNGQGGVTTQRGLPQ